MNIEQITANLAAAAAKRNDAIEQKYQALKTVQAAIDARTTAFKEKLPALVAALAQVGLEIDTIGFFKTGMNDDRWEERDTLKFGLNLSPTSGKFKFIRFNGYKASGAGRNQEKLDAKAASLVAHITASTGLVHVQVNPFSFELRNEQSTKSIMLDIWV